MKSLAEYEELARAAHGHLCAGQILGLRLALYGLRILGIDDPLGTQRKRLVTFVEIDRCATDAISVVTGCRLGKRALKFVDYGKMAATFLDLESGRAVRVAALESSRERATELFPEIEDQNLRQMRAYREMPDEELFDARPVRVLLDERDRPGHRSPRVACAGCGEAISFGREVVAEGRALCRACAGGAYYETLPHHES
jgi:formylmethanofuran dehydrogenase subunit E